MKTVWPADGSPLSDSDAGPVRLNGDTKLDVIVRWKPHICSALLERALASVSASCRAAAGFLSRESPSSRAVPIDALVSTLDRLASGLDAQVAIIPSRLHSAQTVAAVVKNSLKCGDVGGARSAVFQLADDLASAPPALRAALVVSPAPRTGDRRYDAWIAGLVELRLRDVCIPVPAWVRDKDRTVPEEWLVSGIEELRGLTRSDTLSRFCVTEC